MQSTDLHEVARTETQQIADEHHAAHVEAGRKLDRSLRIFLIGSLLIVAANFVINRYFVPEQANPLLCPGDPLNYQIDLDIREPSVVEIDSSVRNMDTLNTEVPSTTTRAIYAQAGLVSEQSVWKVPARLPATNTRPARAWRPGQYRLLIAVTGVEGDKRASVGVVEFRIGANCR